MPVEGKQPFSVLLTVEEAALLVRACQKLQRSIPSYIRANQRDIELLKRVIEKLTEDPSNAPPSSH